MADLEPLGTSAYTAGEMSPRPQIVASFAQTLDGKIAGPDGSSRWISGSETLDLAHRLRGENDGILVGIGTVLADDPELSCRIDGYSSPVRIILDSTLRIPLDSRIVETAHSYETVVFFDGAARDTERRAQQLRVRGIEAVSCSGDDGRLDLRAVLEAVRARGVESVLVEGGGGVLSAFLKTGLIDRLVAVVAPMVLGDGVPAFSETGVDTLSEAVTFNTVSTRMMGKDLVWELTRE